METVFLKFRKYHPKPQAEGNIVPNESKQRPLMTDDARSYLICFVESHSEKDTGVLYRIRRTSAQQLTKQLHCVSSVE